MNKQDRLKDALRALCAQSYCDDAPEPRRDSRRDHSDAHVNSDRDHSGAASPPRGGGAARKAQALAGQVREVIANALRMSLQDPGLSGAEVLDVEITPNGQALVTVAANNRAVPADHVRARLAAAAGLLRAEVARVVVRKRVPTLVFIVVPAPPPPPGPEEEEMHDE